MKTKIVKWLGILVIGLTGCYDYSNFDNIVIDPFSPAYIYPIINSTISFKELAEKAGTNSVVEQHPGSDMYFLNYRDTIDLGMATDLFVIPPVTFDNSITVPAGLIPGVFPFPDIPLAVTYNQTYNTFAGAELKRVDLSSGTLQVNLTNNFNHRIFGEITITSLKDATNSPTVLSFDLPANSPINSQTINLNGYYLDLLDLPSTYNNFQYAVAATITYSGSPSFSGDFAIQLAIDSPAYQKITGKVSYSYVLDNQPYSIGIFASTILAEQHLAEPKLTLNFLNSFGVPSNVDFTRFEVENNLGTTIAVVNEGVAQPGDLLIGTPNTLKNATSLIACDTTKLKLDYANSNIEDLFDIAPRTLSFGATFNIGDAADPSHDYFVRNNSKFQLQSEIEIPLKGWVVTNKITDTIPNIEWPDFENDLNLTNQLFRLKFKFTNGLPIDMYLQTYFLDQTGLIKVDSLFDSGSNWFIKSAPVNAATGESNGTSTAWSYISIDKVKYDKISQSNNMVMVFMFKTRDADLLPPQSITILSSDAITLEMSLEASGTINP
jgi:hypothetical protein